MQFKVNVLLSTRVGQSAHNYFIIAAIIIIIIIISFHAGYLQLHI